MIAPQCLRLSPTDWPSSEWLITHLRCVCVCVCVSFFFCFFLRDSAASLSTADWDRRHTSVATWRLGNRPITCSDLTDSSLPFCFAFFKGVDGRGSFGKCFPSAVPTRWRRKKTPPLTHRHRSQTFDYSRFRPIGSAIFCRKKKHKMGNGLRKANERSPTGGEHWKESCVLIFFCITPKKKRNDQTLRDLVFFFVFFFTSWSLTKSRDEFVPTKRTRFTYLRFVRCFFFRQIPERRSPELFCFSWPLFFFFFSFFFGGNERRTGAEAWPRSPDGRNQTRLGLIDEAPSVHCGLLRLAFHKFRVLLLLFFVSSF